jgi:hypothetical protein
MKKFSLSFTCEGGDGGGGSQAHKNRLSLNPETGVYLPFGFLTVSKVKIRHPSVQTNSDPDPTQRYRIKNY